MTDHQTISAGTLRLLGAIAARMPDDLEQTSQADITRALQMSRAGRIMTDDATPDHAAFLAVSDFALGMALGLGEQKP